MPYSPTTFEDGQVLTGPQLTAEFAKLPAALADTDGAGRVVTSDGRTVQEVLDAATPAADLASSAAGKGAELVTYMPAGTGAVATNVQNKFYEIMSQNDRGAVGDGVADDTSYLTSAFAALPQRGRLTFAPVTAHKITSSLQVFGKAGAIIDFGNQQINAASFSSPAPALHFKTMSQAVINNIFVIGNKTQVTSGVLFDAASGEISIHWLVGKIYASNCDNGVTVGTPLYQFGDGQFQEMYADSCNTGILLTGENTLGMLYGRVAAYANSNIGVHFEQGGGTITSLQAADSKDDLFFGSTSGLDHNKLVRWDILGGYSEIGQPGERWINSSVCADTNPFLEEVVINSYRSTPFSNTEPDFIRWNLNGALKLKNVSITQGQQEPYISLDHNTAYRAPTVDLTGLIDCNPKSATQVVMTYKLTDPRQTVEINAQVNNGMSFWNNGGALGDGVIKRGIYMHKLKKFERALLETSGLLGAWNLRDITSGTCRNLVLGGPSLTTSAALERRDFWLDDGLVGFYRNSTTSKTVSTNSATFAAASEYTFGAILRATSAASSEEDMTNIGGVLGMRIALYNGALLCLVGAANAFNGSANAYDPHLVVGRYVSGTSITVDAVNLRTGDRYSSTTSSGVPAFGSLTWTEGLNFRNDACVRGFPFVYGRALSDSEVSVLLQSATLLTDSWRDA